MTPSPDLKANPPAVKHPLCIRMGYRLLLITINSSNDAVTSFNGDNVHALVDLALALANIELTWNKAKENQYVNWAATIHASNNRDLIALIDLLDTPDKQISREIKVLREAAIGQVSLNNANLISNTMEKLDKIGIRLTVISLILAVIGVIAELFH